MNNNLNKLTTRYGTTIDAIFQRYLNTLEFKGEILSYGYATLSRAM